MVGRHEAKVARMSLTGTVLVLGALIGTAAFGAMRTQVICTEREPADAPTHYRFENGGDRPEIILDLDYTRAEEAVTAWEVGGTYTVAIDDDFEAAAAAPPGNAMFSARAECTAESRDVFHLRTQTTPAMSCSLNWGQDPAPLVKPWTRTRAYTIQILGSPKKVDPSPPNQPGSVGPKAAPQVP